MAYVILDLEWNSGYCKKTKGFLNEIIELGAVKLDPEMNITGQFTIFIRPQITKRLNPMVKELTRLSNEDLIHGVPFRYAVNKFGKFAKDCVIMSWSTSDLTALEANFEYYFGTNRISFLKSYADVQAYCQERLGLGNKNQLSLQNAAEMLEIETDDIPHHRAAGDSILAARILKRLYEPESFEKQIKLCNDDFYARLNFHSAYICNIDNPLIDKSEMYINCDECNVRCERLEELKVRNKGFYSSYKCPSCGRLLIGKIQFKLNYDGVSVSKKVMPYTAEEPSEDNREGTENE